MSAHNYAPNNNILTSKIKLVKIAVHKLLIVILVSIYKPFSHIKFLALNVRKAILKIILIIV